MSDKNELFRKGEETARLSAIVLLAFSVSKGIVAFASGSIALLADSIHSFADIFSSVAVWVGMKMIQKKPSERFPYGYYRAETFALLVVSLTIVASGILILKEAVDNLSEPGNVLFPSLVLLVAALSGVISFFLGRYKRKIGGAIGSQSLIGEGQHSIVDVYTSLLVFVGVLFSSLGYPIVEILASLVIGVYVIKVGAWFGRDAILALMDVSLSPKRVEEIKRVAESVQGVSGVHAIRFRKSGPVTFGEMHLELREDLPLDRAHAISEEVEAEIKKQFKNVESITIHVGTSHKEKIKVGIPILEDKGLASVASPHFGNAPLFIIVEIEKGQITTVDSKVNDAAKLVRKKGMTTAQFLVDEKADAVIVGGLGVGPFHVLNDNLVQIYSLPEPITVKEAVHLLIQNKLKRMTSPIDAYKTEDTDE